MKLSFNIAVDSKIQAWIFCASAACASLQSPAAKAATSSSAQSSMALPIKGGAYLPQSSAALSALESQMGSPELNTPEALQSFGEYQKLLYVSQDWDRFFGRTRYYSDHVFAARPKLAGTREDSNMVALEVLALIKLCNIEGARSLLDSDRSRIPKETQDRLNDFIVLSQKYLPPKGVKDQSPDNTKTVLWPLPKTKPVESIQNYSLLRVQVKNECPMIRGAK